MTRVLLLLAGALVAACSGPPPASLPTAEESRIAGLIFHNECGGRIACLTSWNQGEEFASLGIGHFIWYPGGTPDANKHFHESFPDLLQFLVAQGIALPDWLSRSPGCPWPNRDAFRADQHSERMDSLRQWLQQTMPLQARFIAKRAEAAFPAILALASRTARPHLLQQYERILHSPMGAYALTDYVNFKGEGTDPKERYQGHGWGLLQVLAEMRGEDVGIDAIRAFRRAADIVLTRRVALSPPERHESRWLQGWRNRLATYTTEAERFAVR